MSDTGRYHARVLRGTSQRLRYRSECGANEIGKTSIGVTLGGRTSAGFINRLYLAHFLIARVPQFHASLARLHDIVHYV